ncbi:hypothetical protein [Mesorhizobium delmotii]|uniref:Uncharacterized protein n=1 Tax=Mesorhizobium delmotii TaxID=1631247 RepID=A0A2P9AXB9_9HYPH|nr:hypothetical protein [Mesorhizobium delmotii]SJM35824.1 conserved hypothetical protein [Mesorhizobium delmotii]
MVEGEFHVVAHCPSCGVPADAWLTEVPAPDLTAESASDAIATGDIEIECETCGNVFPVTITAHLTGWEAHLTDDPKTKAEFEQLDYSYDDWLEEMEPEPHPRAIFNQAISDWTSLLHLVGDKRSGAAGINRMLLVQLFSIIEAYLSDAVIKLAFEDRAVAKAIVEWHPDLKVEQVSLTTVASQPNLVRDMVVAQLRKKTQFHRFEFLNGMLRAAIGHRLLPGDKVKRDLILQSVQSRHHCVHRNGRDVDGKILDSVTVDYLDRLARCFMETVERLATAIDEIEAKRPSPLSEDLLAIQW